MLLDLCCTLSKCAAALGRGLEQDGHVLQSGQRMVRQSGPRLSMMAVSSWQDQLGWKQSREGGHIPRPARTIASVEAWVGSSTPLFIVPQRLNTVSLMAASALHSG